MFQSAESRGRRRGRILHPPGAPCPPSCAGTPQKLPGNPHKVVAGGVRGVLDVAGRIGEDDEDGVNGEVDPASSTMGKRLRRASTSSTRSSGMGSGRPPPMERPGLGTPSGAGGSPTDDADEDGGGPDSTVTSGTTGIVSSSVSRWPR